MVTCLNLTPAQTKPASRKRPGSGSYRRPRSRKDRKAATTVSQSPVTLWDREDSSAKVPTEEQTPELSGRRELAETGSALSQYMNHAGEVPLLTVEDEIRLARRIKRGDAVAREHMIRANLRLVIKIARDYEGFGLPLLDLISEGNIGLMRAVDKFDPAKGAKLSTYAALWIKQQMRRALANQSKTIRLPVHMVEKIARMRRACDEHVETHGCQPTDEELARTLKLSVKKVALMRRSSMRPSSLDAPLSEPDSSRLGELVPDHKAETGYEELERKTRVTLLLDFMRQLDEREAGILAMRFGLDGGEGMTLEEIGEQFGVTRERIRQVQNEALTKLRRLLEHREALPIAA